MQRLLYNGLLVFLQDIEPVRVLNSEPVSVNVLGALESTPRKRFRQPM
jgi:hypothetical protein